MTYFNGTHVAVKYLGPTNARGSRYKATIDQGGSFKFSATVPYDYALDSYGNQFKAVEAVAQKFLEHNGYYDHFEVLAATVDNFIIDFRASDEVAA